ncbi:hypothetical protein IM40_01580 [Candidatus Paracaedimonas acanthamoebae]|nr:hypothetical protein IM40_01580 [Candidatus Paracaedimonas acanthamoebae]
MTNMILFTAVTGCTKEDLNKPAFPQTIASSTSEPQQDKISLQTTSIAEKTTEKKEYGEIFDFKKLSSKTAILEMMGHGTSLKTFKTLKFIQFISHTTILELKHNKILEKLIVILTGYF